MVKRTGGWLLGGVLVAALLAPVPASPGEHALKEAELSRLRSRIELLRGEIGKVRTRYDGTRTALRDTERSIARFSTSLRELDVQRATRTQRLRTLRSEKLQHQVSIEGQRGYLASQVRAAYAMGRQEYVKILLNQEDPAAVGRALAYYDYLNRARSERISDLLKTLERLDLLDQEITLESQQLDTLKQQRLAEKQSLEKTRADRERLLTQLKEEIETKDGRLAGLLADEKELEKLLRALAEALADIPEAAGQKVPFGQLRGKLSWPTKGPISARFGTARGQGGLRWQGVLIDAAEGQEVRSVSHGRVAFADWLRGYGLLLIVDHGDGFMSLYGHNQSLYKEAGDWVDAGELVGHVGNSGGQERAALYFEIRQNGRPANPGTWCATRG